jgi:prevent-host-death family protein
MGRYYSLEEAMATVIGAGEFKAKCLRLLDEVAQRHVEVTITKRGRPIARLVPVQTGRPLFGALAGSVVREDDLITPLDDRRDASS